MALRRLSSLEGALLGLIHDEPRSGYALRKLFATSPMGRFSDSPGSIYPALARLARRGLIEGNVENARSLRPRRVYRLAAAGRAALEDWLRQPMVSGGMNADFSLVLLRFVFMPQTIGRAETVRFLRALEVQLARRLAGLRAYYRRTARSTPPSGRLGLQAGIEICAAHAKWATLARRALTEGPRAKGRTR